MAQFQVYRVVHTWGSAPTHHPHIHMIVPSGGLLHSFGTYIVGHLIRNEPSFRVRRVIFCGSILPYDFDC